MTVHQLSRRDARRLAVRAQLLGRERPAGLMEMVRGLTAVQLDQTAAVAPNADLVAWSRLGSSYSPAELAEALATLELLELRGFARPSESLVLFRAEMEAWPGTGPLLDWQEYRRDWVKANEGCRLDILERLRQDGPLVMRELPDTCVVPWKSSGWTNNRNVSQLLEFMIQRGEVAIAGRDGRDKLWDLATRVYPDEPAIPIEEARRIRDGQRLRSHGILRVKGESCPGEPLDAGVAGERAVVDGVRGEWRVDPELLGQPFAGRTALLSPLDRLVYDRKRILELFEFDYQLEMYKPVAKRRWGYFALPILHGDRLVGKVDATSDRKAGVFRVDAIHEDAPFSKALSTAVHRELQDLAKWLQLHLVVKS
ncbi:winged helix-turn-helix domain-containing protein [Kribbella capetownensis]|uniref:Winged helix-turn-helix domain-containing protein n=1 Tax=Kribbella capetownensis TaxID=1572659 RepID=A0A4R0JEB8_9ACTN|nr:crosslink repair DNA glycosylase YcaQ family protein [Kribbella capetownensis]TCC44320.1 winged helix-turn-helix domain-containing protein [Kribbella capetownensis]